MDKSLENQFIYPIPLRGSKLIFAPLRAGVNEENQLCSWLILSILLHLKDYTYHNARENQGNSTSSDKIHRLRNCLTDVHQEIRKTIFPDKGNEKQENRKA